MKADRRIRTSLISIAADIALISGKALLGLFTGSLALVADAMHSASDLGVSFIVLMGLLFRRRVESREGDAGREKRLCRIEAGLAYAVACLILYAPYEIVSTLLTRKSAPIDNLGVGIAGILACIALTGFIARLKLQVGRATGSAALTADGYHSSTDLFSSIAVLFAVMGDAIGIRLDPIVAGLIAILIGVTGIELFVASTRALIRGEPLRTDDLGEFLLRAWRRLWSAPKNAEEEVAREGSADVPTPATAPARSSKPLRQRLLTALARLRPTNPRRWAFGLAAMVLLAWLSTGVTAINPEETGVRLRFGRIVGSEMKPGLHLTLPWPLEMVARVRPSEIRRVEIGFRTARNGKHNRLFDESLFIAGDESLVDLNLVVHYRRPNALTALVRARSNDELVRALTEASVREVLATETTDAILTQEQPRILARIEARIREDFEALNLDLSLVDLLLTEARPPTAVTQAFRDVFSAREDQIKALQQAEARRNDAIPKARAESVVYISEATSFALDKRLRAEGDAERFRLESAAWKLSPEVTSYRLFIETVEKGLANRKKIVANPRANFGGYQLWLFGPQQAPFLKN
ncbi:MAG: protease modulator HflK family protein [Myxococcaceae bacterium]|nr:protease modulator HflK family protein [Myxococcaceae bacterium]